VIEPSREPEVQDDDACHEYEGRRDLNALGNATLSTRLAEALRSCFFGLFRLCHLRT